jgi:hypothetical protein
MSRKHSSAFALIERFAKEVKTYIRATRLEAEASSSAARADGSFADPTDGSVYAQRRILDDLLPARAERLAARDKIISDAPALMEHLTDRKAMLSLLNAVKRGQFAEDLWPPVQVELRAMNSTRDYWHSPDFASVRWAGATHVFTANQRPVVKALWEAMRDGTPDLSAIYLLKVADTASKKLSEVFRQRKGKKTIPHKAWGTIIVPSGKDTYRLNR